MTPSNSSVPSARSASGADWLPRLMFVLTLLALLVGGAAGLLNTTRLAEDRRLVVHTKDVLVGLEVVQAGVTDAETGQRGYLLTGDSAYLEPYNTSLKRIHDGLGRLRVLVDDNSAQVGRLSTLDRAVAAKLEELASTITLNRQGDRDAALAVVRDGTGRQLMAEIRDAVGAMQQEEQGLLAERARTAAVGYRRVLAIIALTAAIGLGLVVLVFRISRRHLQQERRAAAVLAEQKERLRTTLASIGDGVITTDEHAHVTGMNAIAEALTRWKLTDALGRHVDDVFRIIDRYTRDPVASPALRALHEGIVVGLANSVLLVARDGSEVPMDDSGAPIRAADGRITGSVLVFRDVTERQASRERLREAHSRLESTLAAGEIGTFEFDIRTGVVRADGNCARLMRLTPAEAAGVPLHTFTRDVHPDYRNGIEGMITRVLTSSDVLEEGCPLLDKGDGIRWIAIRGRAERDDAGHALRLAGVVVEITAQRRAEERERVLLEESATANAKFRALFDQGALFAGIMQVDGRVIETNRLAWEGCGFTREQTLGKPFWEGPWWSPSPVLMEQVRMATMRAAAGESFRAEMPYFVGSGEERIIDLGILPIRNVSGTIAFLAPTGSDITERKRAEADRERLLEERRQMEEELRTLAANLSESNRRKDEFLATLAHELRNPLAPIRNGLEIIRMAREDQVTVQRARSMMERQLQQMVHLVDDLLDVNRISSGKLELRLDDTDLATVINSAIETSRPILDSRQQDLVLFVPAVPVLIRADTTRLVQVFANLLNNAAKYSETGSRITLSVEPDSDTVAVSVKDSGVGIPPEMLPRIFELFIQADRTLHHAQGGLGIGLTLVKRLVDMHGGTVEARSLGTGQGSEFIVRLPVRQDSVAPLGTAEVPRPPAEGAHYRILVADDNEDSATSLAQMLTMMGHEVRTAYDGQDALDVASAFHPDLVLLDIGMPKLNGYEVCIRIRSHPWARQAVIAAVSGWSQDADKVRSRQAGFNHHFDKPLQMPALQQVLATLSSARRDGN